MSYVSMDAAREAGAQKFGTIGAGKLNEATGLISFAKAPAPTAPTLSRLETASFPHAARTAASRHPVARRYMQSLSFARHTKAYRQVLTPRHEPAPRPAAVHRRSYDLLKTLQQAMVPQRKQEAPKEVMLAVKQLPYKPVRQMAKMALGASGYNFG